VTQKIVQPRDIRELEAECVALLCCESLRLPGAAESRALSSLGSTVTKYQSDRHNGFSTRLMKS
jgi:hypothetical protein